MVVQGFIKDYDGAHLMECFIHPTLNYLDRTVLARQRDFILSRINEVRRGGPPVAACTLAPCLHTGLQLPPSQSLTPPLLCRIAGCRCWCCFLVVVAAPRQVAKSQHVYPGIHGFRSGRRLGSPLDIPGVKEAGWTAKDLGPQLTPVLRP